MIRLVTLLICIFAFTNNIKAQDSTISISYQTSKDKFVQQLMDFQKIYGFDVVISGKSLKGKNYQLWMVRNQNGEEKRKKVDSEVQCIFNDTIQHFYFFAQSQINDSVKIACNHSVGEEETIYMPDSKHCILMETIPSKVPDTSKSIPLIAYTNGYEQKLNYNGEELNGISYCAIRNARIHPSEWYKKFNLKNYIYFELIFK